MNKSTLIILLAISATSLRAESSMTADEFDAYTRDKTFYYGNQGQPYGAEEYLSDRRVIWTFLDGRCENGTWYQDGKQICFVYESQSEPQCWSFRLSSKGLVAQFEDDPEETQLYEVETSHEPLMCLGPEVGV